ncbi:hypothetical protein TrST_g2331 [Triparma strigata]|uniref:AMP-dependent synthetase/ligase domain-containing protein n=1 Tax=Triparma strigata TaxID=1606541 RepID=A0A9W6ZW93_9STRA|nr:hypothetical protein TrST_g2331 [Triparma strigata]
MIPLLALAALGSVVAYIVIWLILSPYPMSLPFSLLTLLRFLFSLKSTTRMVQRVPWNTMTVWESRVKSTPNNDFMINLSNATTFTYKSANELSLNVSSAIQSLPGCKCLALLMPSCAEYVCLWLGLSRVGCTAALINTNLMGTALVHAIKTAVGDSETKRVVVSEELLTNVDAVRGQLSSLGIEVLVYYHNTNKVSGFNKLLEQTSGTPVDQDGVPARAWNSDLFYIYTSGTTGLPKASKINHLRFYIAGLMFSKLCRAGTSDRIYCALPLYHSAGGMLGVSGAICAGATIVLRSKFSVSKLSSDLVTNKCTIMQYIGEFARFAVNGSKTPELDALAGKTCRVAFGNGMRPEVWSVFQKRFNIPNVIEFYGSTEGNATLVNNTNVVGAIGVIPWFAKFLYPVRLVRCDNSDGTLTRGEDGLAQVAAPDEPGHLLGLIKDNDPTRRFDGYTDKAATEKKIVQNVLSKGDRWFASGDLLRSDSFGFLFWVDRIGDTFRWKGENVSTAEVAAAFIAEGGERSKIDDVNVYGVEIEGKDGRAGMGRVALKAGVKPSSMDYGSLYKELAAELPGYAMPVFLRIPLAVAVAEEGEAMTGTFKHKKGPLREQGFSLVLVGIEEALYFRDDGKKTFVKMDLKMEKAIREGKIRV